MERVVGNPQMAYCECRNEDPMRAPCLSAEKFFVFLFCPNRPNFQLNLKPAMVHFLSANLRSKIMIAHDCKLLGTVSLVVAFISSNCASHVYTLTQLQGDERLQQDLQGKRVEVLHKDDSMTTGYFSSITVDTLMLYRKKNEHAPLPLPAYEVYTIRVLASQETEFVVAGITIGVLVLLFIAAQGYSDAFSSLGH
jgi:hypothetical protein